MECGETRRTSVLGGISLWSFRSQVRPQGSEAGETWWFDKPQVGTGSEQQGETEHKVAIKLKMEAGFRSKSKEVSPSSVRTGANCVLEGWQEAVHFMRWLFYLLQNGKVLPHVPSKRLFRRQKVYPLSVRIYPLSVDPDL